MDIIDQLFPQTKSTDNVIDQYLEGQEPWQILQSVWNDGADEVAFWREMNNPAPPKKIIVELKRK